MTIVAPVLIITSGPSDNTPTFQLFGDIQSGDVETLSFATNSSFTGDTQITHTVTSTDMTTGTFTFSTGSLANGTWYFRANTNRSSDISPWSNTQQVTISASGGGIVLDDTLPDGLLNSLYAGSVIASGGTAPYTYAVTSGSVPIGLTLSSAGALTGTPTAVGTFSFGITATDSLSATGGRSYSVIITAPAYILMGAISM